LTPLGRRQSELVAERIKKFKPEIIYASPMGRAVETAKIIGGLTDLPHIVFENLHEIDAGCFSGKHINECGDEWNAYFDLWKRGEKEKRIPGGESFNDVAKRMREALTKIASGSETRIAAISHNAAIGIFIKSIAGETGSDNCIPKGGTKNGGTAVSEIEFETESSSFKTIYAMDLSHIPEENN
jgi:broad specificity phosphatase PhoE